MSLKDAHNKIERRWIDYNRFRPHSSLGDPTPEEFRDRHLEAGVFWFWVSGDGVSCSCVSDTDNPTGNHRVARHGNDEVGNRLAAGIYLYHVAIGGPTLIGKMALLR